MIASGSLTAFVDHGCGDIDGVDALDHRCHLPRDHARATPQIEDDARLIDKHPSEEPEHLIGIGRTSMVCGSDSAILPGRAMLRTEKGWLRRSHEASIAARPSGV
jgi:hypothetical protein